VASKPSGTLATIIPMANIMLVMKGYYSIIPMKKKKIPIQIEIMEMMNINLSSSIRNGVFVPEATAAKFAI